MKIPSIIISAGLLFLASSLVHADSKTEVSEAIAKLGGQPGYSWTSTPATEGSKSAARQGPLDGKTEKGGYTRIKTSSGETPYEVGFKGEKIVVNGLQRVRPGMPVMPQEAVALGDGQKVARR